MACYHFTMKLDRKPSGIPISAVAHLDYINREGSYKNLDFEQAVKAQRFSGNMLCPVNISSTECQNTLYRSLYGSIVDNGIGIECTDHATQETVQIALAVARKRYGETLDVRGSDAYKARVLVAASAMEYPVHFTDDEMEKQYQKLKEEQRHGRERIRESSKSGTGNASLHLPHLEPVGTRRPSSRRNSLQILSECNLDEEPRHAGVLLPGDHAACMEQQASDRHPALRRSQSLGIRRRIERTADQIIAQSQGAVLASSHADYINRREGFARKGGCLFTANHLPKWAHGSAKEFFQAADLYERVNGSRYREIEFALPNELNLEQQKEMIQTFLDCHLKDFYYAYAIHDKVGAMSNGERNPHVHIMFSEREIDEIERNEERPAKLFFHRANSRHPERGGAPKAEKWIGKDRSQYLCKMREDFARIQNETLKKYGADARVDHRSLRDQYLESLSQDNYVKAALLDRLPEPHVGPIAAADRENEKVVSLLAYRAHKLEHSRLAYLAGRLENEIECDTLRMEIQAHRNGVDELDDQMYFDSIPATVTQMREQIHSDLQSITALQQTIIWQSKADMMSREKFLTLEEREKCRELEDIQSQRIDLENLRNALPQPDPQASDEDWDDYRKFANSIAKDIGRLSDAEKEYLPMVQEIEKRFATSEMKYKLHQEAQRIISDDIPQKMKLKAINERVRDMLPRLQDLVTRVAVKDARMHLDGDAEKTAFTAEELLSYLTEQSHWMERNLKTLQSHAQKTKHKILSVSRAAFMARSVYLKGADTKLRDRQEAHAKEEKRLEAARMECHIAEERFHALPEPKWYQNSKAYKEERQNLKELQAALSSREEAYCKESSAMEAEKNRLDMLCSSEQGKEKIVQITQGILSKNQPVLKEYNVIQRKISTLQSKLSAVQDVRQGLQKQMLINRGKKISYPIRSSVGTTGNMSYRENMMDLARRIASHHVSGAGLQANLDAKEQLIDYMTMSQSDRDAEQEKNMNV